MLRELPLKNFYARAAIIGFTYFYLVKVHWNFFPSDKNNNVPYYYMNKYDENEFENFPMLKDLVTSKRRAKVNNPGQLESDLWYNQQFQSHYMNHFKHYRYIFRNRRVVPWDGTFNQPVFPYINNNDRTSFVHNGTMEIIEPKPSGNW